MNKPEDLTPLAAAIAKARDGNMEAGIHLLNEATRRASMQPVAPTGKVSEGDEALVQQIVDSCKFGYADNEVDEESTENPDVIEASYRWLNKRFTAALATVRREQIRAIRERIATVNPHLTFGSANGSMMKKCILAEVDSIEAAANGESNG